MVDEELKTAGIEAGRARGLIAAAAGPGAGGRSCLAPTHNARHVQVFCDISCKNRSRREYHY